MSKRHERINLWVSAFYRSGRAEIVSEDAMSNPMESFGVCK